MIKREKRKLMMMIFALIIIPSLAFSALKCLYVCFVTSWGTPPDLCLPVFEKMEEWGYEMTYIAVDALATYTLEDYQKYDFIFIVF